jgi:glycosyltransferase involved in cell wall biosynthesis
MLSVIIPTRNRPELLIGILDCISNQTRLPTEVIVVDSSSRVQNLNEDIKQQLTIRYVHVNIQSAAEQRNIGIMNVDPKNNYIAFLDDDVMIDSDYFEKLITFLDHENYIGVSGVVSRVELEKSNFSKLKIERIYKRLFLLDSKYEGKLLKSGINTPIFGRFNEPKEVEWLMGCSLWRSEIINKISFERDLRNQSLGEDVIFSHKARAYGKLAVVPTVRLNHSVSQIGRANEVEFWTMWVQNRYRLIQIMNGGQSKLAPYFWANLGQVILEVAKSLSLRNNDVRAAATIVKESTKVFLNHFNTNSKSKFNPSR